ncbi:MAG: amidohydrolase family protein, partial [Bacteroidetes bacterium]|nr:amidohydrolase family protein [Bacteroidota bacterium]
MVNKISGNIVDVFKQRIYPAAITIENGKISSIRELPASHLPLTTFILPGFIDSHVHIESSMLVPSEFARLA